MCMYVYTGPMSETQSTSSRYETNAYRQTCTCMAGQYGRMCKHLRAAMDQTEGQRIADLTRRALAADKASQRSMARNSYPGTD